VAAQNICRGVVHSDDTQRHLEEAAHASATLIDPRTAPYCERRVLAISTQDQTTWRVDVRSDKLGTSRSFVNSILDKCANGDVRNTARFWVNHFLKNRYHSPVSELVFPAAYAVIMAGNENPSTIAGLEFYVILRNGSVIRSTRREEDQLLNKAAGLNRTIRRQLFKKFELSG
jgi:hypothetical protein